jgi:hypothetical protein
MDRPKWFGGRALQFLKPLMAERLRLRRLGTFRIWSRCLGIPLEFPTPLDPV